MLVLTRKNRESVVIGQPGEMQIALEITILEIEGGRVRQRPGRGVHGGVGLSLPVFGQRRQGLPRGRVPHPQGRAGRSGQAAPGDVAGHVGEERVLHSDLRARVGWRR